MTETCETIRHVLSWADATRRIPVVYTGMGRTYRSAPAPYLELAFMLEGEVRQLHLGDRVERFANHHLALHSVHHGSISNDTEPFCGWCSMLDVSDVPEFSSLYTEPLFCSVPVREPGRVLDAFRRLVVYGRSSGWTLAGYPPPPGFHEDRATRSIAFADEMLLKSPVLELLGLMLHEAERQAAPAHAALPRSVVAAIDYMELHYTDSEIALPGIAQAASLSEDHFGRMFRKEMRMTPMQYLRARRVEQAAFLLQNTRMRVEEVGREVGFKDPFHFSRAFRRIQGVSPRQYRNRLPGDE